MARPLRLQIPGAVYHVTSRADGDEMLFRDDAERELFLRRYAEAISEHDWYSLAYCVMGTHYHLLIETPRTTLIDGMRDLNGRFARDRHRLRGARGHVFGERYHGGIVQRDAHLIAAVRYIARNPVEAGICRHARDWPWSSHRDLCAGRTTAVLHPDRVLRYFATDPSDARRGYQRLVEESQDAPSVTGDTGVAGDHEFARRHLPGDLPSVEIPRRYLEPVRPPLDVLLRGGTRETAVLAARKAGYTLQEIGSALGVHRSTVLRWTRQAGA